MFNRTGLTSRKAIWGFIVFAVIVLGISASVAFWPKRGVSQVNVDAAGVAIHGYDTVAYFVDGKATQGKPEFEYVWQGARWHFANATNRDLFAADPARYAPRYGGYCSMGLAMGEYSDVDPNAWTIVDGKLYLNQAKWVRDQWRKGKDAYIFASDANWAHYRTELRVDQNLNK